MENITPAKDESRYPFLVVSRFFIMLICKSISYGDRGILLDTSVLLQMDTYGAEL